jgi:hypothetical protein
MRLNITRNLDASFSIKNFANLLILYSMEYLKSYSINMLRTTTERHKS